jgi:hypothetical protein
MDLKNEEVNYLEVSPRGIYSKIIKNSKQASEHSNLDYRVKIRLRHSLSNRQIELLMKGGVIKDFKERLTS